MHAAQAIAAALCLLTMAGRAAEPVDAARCAAMKAHHVLNPDAPVGCARLAVVRFSYVDFAGRSHTDGTIVVMDALAPSVERLFAALYARRFAIAKALPMEAFDGDDNAAMADNNTSSFNHRVVAGTTHLSLHAYGAAIDVNQMQNPFLTRNGAVVNIAPAAGTAFLNRREGRAGKPPRAGMAEAVTEIFADNGFLEWGGDWDDPIDYQHFDIGRALAEKLVALPSDRARDVFASVVGAYQHCAAQLIDKPPAERRQSCAARSGK